MIARVDVLLPGLPEPRKVLHPSRKTTAMPLPKSFFVLVGSAVVHWVFSCFLLGSASAAAP